MADNSGSDISDMEGKLCLWWEVTAELELERDFRPQEEGKSTAEEEVKEGVSTPEEGVKERTSTPDEEVKERMSTPEEEVKE